jgi:hypothetical protein
MTGPCYYADAPNLLFFLVVERIRWVVPSSVRRLRVTCPLWRRHRHDACARLFEDAEPCEPLGLVPHDIADNEILISAEPVSYWG